MAQNTHEIKALAARYVSALFDLAQAQNKQQVVASDLANLIAATESHADWQRMVRSPMVAADEKINAFSALLSALKADPLTTQQVAFVVRQQRAEILPVFALLYQEMVLAQQGQLQAEVVSAAPLSAAQEKRIADALKAAAGTAVHLQCRVDASLIGGLTIRMGSRMLDRSVAGKLNRLSASLAAGHESLQAA